MLSLLSLMVSCSPSDDQKITVKKPVQAASQEESDSTQSEQTTAPLLENSEEFKNISPSQVEGWMKRELKASPEPGQDQKIKVKTVTPLEENSNRSTPSPAQIIVSENPFMDATKEVFNPDPGAYASMSVPQTVLSQPLPEASDYELGEMPESIDQRGQSARSIPAKMPKFKPGSMPKPGDVYDGLPAHTELAGSRWVPYSQHPRYPDPETAETPLQDEIPYLWHPYKQSILKGDVPILGENVFLKITAQSRTDFEANDTPTGSGISGADPNNAEFFGEGDTLIVQQNTLLTIDLFQGETEVFKPFEWRLRLQPVINVNYFQTTETGVLQPDVRGETATADTVEQSFTVFDESVLNPASIEADKSSLLDSAPGDYNEEVVTRRREFVALQEGFFEFHVTDISSTYDFISTRSGYQVFNSDFRGLVFFDTNLGYRIFGNAENNLWNYNLAFFDIREKDTNSELNTFKDRGQDVFIANLYRQDFIWPGYTINLSGLVNIDSGNQYDNENDFPIRPAIIGQIDQQVRKDVNSYYLGFSGEGKFGRVNISHSFYQVFGKETFNSQANQETEINAQQAHVEVSYDRDWIRYKGTFFYASGDSDPEDGVAEGFDSIIDNPFLIGGPFSYWVRQGLGLPGTGVALKQRNSLIPNFRAPNKFEGQSNFVNPGVMIFGVGTDIELTSETRLFFNANYIRFVETNPLKQVLFDNKIDHEVGYDLSAGIIARPLLNDTFVINAGIGLLIPGQGFEDIYGFNEAPVETFDSGDGKDFEEVLYSAFIQCILTW
ncbi:MAG: hypothetical protein AAFY98_00405 [Verrucomicrobiota bacterium]